MFEQHSKITQSAAFFEPDTAAHFYLRELSSAAQYNKLVSSALYIPAQHFLRNSGSFVNFH
jgi:hypothetical protein